MIQLWGSILSSTLIFVIFRLAKNYQSRLSALITYNYLAATLLGLLFFRPLSGLHIENFPDWLPFGVLNGVLFIAIFFLIGQSSQKAGITVTTLATKLSLVFPVMFSLIYYHENITGLRLVGLVSAFIAIALTLYKKDIRKINPILIFLPLLIFLGSGVVDSVVKFVQAEKISANQTAIYTTSVFLVAFLCGLLLNAFSKNTKWSIHPPTLFFGTLLGIVNFGSLYFLIEALNKANMKSSLLFALNNMAIVALTAFLGWLLFKEKLNKVNFAGIALALVSLYFLL